MQSTHRILSLFLILSMTTVSAWGAEETVVDDEEGSTSLQPSNIEGWSEVAVGEKNSLYPHHKLKPALSQTTQTSP